MVAQSAPGDGLMQVTTSIAYSVREYQVNGWSSLGIRNKLDVVRYRKPSPGICPQCGAGIPHLFNRSGKYRDDDSDYEWLCRRCRHKNLKPKKTFIKPGDKLKPWSELKRRGKVARIRRALLKPAACQYCDIPDVELMSRSGAWLEDLTDYTWVCRHHALMIKALQPEPQPKPQLIIIEPELCFLASWYNYESMPGTFEGHSILNKNSAGGRFLAFEPSSLKKHLLS